MTTTDILGLQRRMRQLGEIRIGHVIDTGRVSEKTGRPIKYPAKLDKFRVTSASRPTLEEVAKLYGGKVQEWTPANGGPKEWEAYTETDRLPVIIPPKNAVTQCMEMYQGSKCVRRCNTRIEEKSDRPCFCDPDKRACQLTTRLNVMLRDVPGLGVWLLTSHGYYAAVELPPVADFLATTNGYVDAFLTMELKRVTLDEGKVAEFMVPKIDVLVTPAQLLAGHGAISAPALAATREQAAITGGEDPATAEWQDRAEKAETFDQLSALLQEANKAGFAVEPTSPLRRFFVERAKQLKDAADGSNEPPAPAGTSPAPAGLAVDPMDVWVQIVAAAGEAWTTSKLEDAFAAWNNGTHAGSANATQLVAFLAELKAGRINPAGAEQKAPF